MCGEENGERRGSSGYHCVTPTPQSKPTLTQVPEACGMCLCGGGHVPPKCNAGLFGRVTRHTLEYRASQLTNHLAQRSCGATASMHAPCRPMADMLGIVQGVHGG